MPKFTVESPESYEANEWGQCQVATAGSEWSKRCRKMAECLAEYDSGHVIEVCQFHATILRDRGLATIKGYF